MKKKYTHQTINGIKKKTHRWIMEEKIGRTLLANEHVYHLDGDSSNNDPNNLVIIVKNQKI